MDFVPKSPLTQQSAVSEADSPHSSQNLENSAPGTAGETLSMATAELSPGLVTSDSRDLHSVDQAGLSAGRSSLWYQGTDYTILDESPPKQALCLSQEDPILELVSYPEALQLALSCRFGDFASLRFEVSGQPQVVFRLVGSVQPSRQSARAPHHSVSSGTPQAAAWSQAGAPSMVHSSSMDLSLGVLPLRLHGPREWMGDPRLLDRAPITLLHLVPICSEGDFGYQAGFADTRRDYSPLVPQSSWADQVEYQDRLDMAYYPQVETGRQPNYLPPPWTKPRARPNAKRRAKLWETYKTVGMVRDRPSMGPTPTTLTIMKGRSMGRTKSLMRKVTTVILTAVLAGRTVAPHLLSGLVSRDAIQ